MVDVIITISMVYLHHVSFRLVFSWLLQLLGEGGLQVVATCKPHDSVESSMYMYVITPGVSMSCKYAINDKGPNSTPVA